MLKQENDNEEKELIGLIKLVDDNFSWKLYDALSFSPIALCLFFIVYLGFLLFFYFAVAPLPERVMLTVASFALIITFYQMVVSMPKLLQERAINKNYKKISSQVKVERKPILKALIMIKSKQPDFPLLAIYTMNKSLFEKEKLLDKLYE